MLLDILYKCPTVFLRATLVAFTSIRDVSSRLVASLDICKQVQDSETTTKVTGDKCIKLDAGKVNREDVENIDIGILGCGEVLTCLEDESSSTGARCVAFEGVSVYEKASCSIPYCLVNSDCCDDMICNRCSCDDY